MESTGVSTINNTNSFKKKTINKRNIFFLLKIFELLYEATVEEQDKIEKNNFTSLIRTPFIDYSINIDDPELLYKYSIKKLKGVLIQTHASYFNIVATFIYLDKLMMFKPLIFMKSSLEK